MCWLLCQNALDATCKLESQGHALQSLHSRGAREERLDVLQSCLAVLRWLDAGHRKRRRWHGEALHPEQTVDAATETVQA